MGVLNVLAMMYCIISGNPCPVLTVMQCSVFFQLKVDALNFFPMNRALSLTYMEDDTVEDQIKDMTVKIRTLQQQHIAQVTLGPY